MATIDVINQAGAVVGSIELNDAVFGIEPHQQAMYDALVMQMASRRQGTADTKGRSEVSGGGRKPYRQKGTGRARQGSIRATQFRGGGTVFGATPRIYAYRINKKVRRLAVKSALSEKVQETAFSVLDKFEIAEPKKLLPRAHLTPSGEVRPVSHGHRDAHAGPRGLCGHRAVHAGLHRHTHARQP